MQLRTMFSSVCCCSRYFYTRVGFGVGGFPSDPWKAFDLVVGKHTHTHAYTHKYIHTYIHIYIYIYIYIHTHTHINIDHKSEQRFLRCAAARDISIRVRLWSGRVSQRSMEGFRFGCGSRYNNWVCSAESENSAVCEVF